ncbi:MAG: winged helix-turn-helix transcriptional regulator [Nanoarchaeota archaeon]|nr:winged helix-turn-helix transcriptional regulator [Nanoarchaeota archaeon]
MELKEKDLKLLSYFYHNNRESLTKIAKETGMTRIQVEHSLKKFIKEGIIEKFFTMFNYSAFGYNVYILMLIKLEKYSSLQKFTKKLEASKNCISFGECFGKYDLFTNLIFKDEEDMSDFLSEMISEKGEQVLDYLIIKPYLAEFHPLKLFYNKKKLILSLVGERIKKQKFSEHDLKILKELEKDGRSKIIDIAKKTGVSAEMVLHKLRKFKKEKVVLGIKAGVRMKKVGYNYSMVFLNVKNFSKFLKNKIIYYARNEKKVNVLVLSLFNPNCMVQIFHKTDDELKNEIKKIKELLKNEIFDLDVVLAQEEDKVNTLPFL